jgi:hypothetical protein
MAGELGATYGGFYQPLRDWYEVYHKYIRREAIEQDLPTQYLTDLDIVRVQPMKTNIEFVAWTRSDFNVDILVGILDH